MPNFGPVHKLIIHEVGAPYGPLDTGEFEDFDVIHPAECKYENDQYRCGVGWNIEQGGARWSLHYVGTPVTVPGEYAIRAWAETYRGFDYTEYDGGIALVRSDDPDAAAAEMSDVAIDRQMVSAPESSVSAARVDSTSRPRDRR